MNKIKFQMSAQDYYYGYQLKLKATKAKNNIWWFILFYGIIILALIIFSNQLSILILAGMFLAFSILMIYMPTKKMCMREYNASPFNNKSKSIMFDESSISFISAFEKITMNWQDIFAYSIDNDLIIILPLVSSEIYVINKKTSAQYQQEINIISDMLVSKCKKINISKNIPESEKALVQNEEVSVQENVFPFSINCAYDFDDNVKNQKLNIKRRTTMSFMYIMTLFLIALGVYNYIILKNAEYLILSAIAVGFVLGITLLCYFVIPRINAKKVVRADKFIFLKRKICFEKEYIEAITDSAEKNIKISRIIPYNYIQNVLESEEYFSIFASAEKHILVPKRYLNEKQIAVIAQELSNKCFYRKVK